MSDCEDRKDRVLSAINRYVGGKAKFINCEKDPDELMESNFVSEIPIRITANKETATKEGLGSVFVTSDFDPPETVSVIAILNTENAHRIAKVIEEMSWRSDKIKDIAISVKVVNDLADDINIIVNSSYVNTEPVDELTAFRLGRRDAIEIVPSDTRRQSFLKNEGAWIFGIEKNEQE
ncbi:MAG TPA: hypothetical protein PKD55_12975 [Bellilinea sp.]|nr:hypothetical protein [Bellilinea sp.]